MNWLVTVYAAVLFFVLSPNVLLRLPPKGDKFLVAAVHAVIFALVLYFSHMVVLQGTESFKEGACPPYTPNQYYCRKKIAGLYDAGNQGGCAAKPELYANCDKSQNGPGKKSCTNNGDPNTRCEWVQYRNQGV
jgi:hypothetical protein